jgi:hypothetical protein
MQTYYTLINGEGTWNIYNGKSTVLSLNFMQENVSSDTDLKCDDTLIYRNFAKDTRQVELYVQCDGQLKIVKTGQDSAMAVVNYLNYHETSTTSVNEITDGDILIAFFIFLGLLGSIFGFMVDKFIFKK